MPSTKTPAIVFNNNTLVAGAGDTTSGTEVLTTGYGGSIGIKLTNGAAGPTVPAQVQIRVSVDNAEWYNYGGPLVGGVANNGVYSWSIDFGIGIPYLRLVAGSNTAQDVVVDADLSEVTAL